MPYRFNKDTCRSGRHAWIDENIIVKNGVKNCHPCLLEKQRAYMRSRRDRARQMGEAELIGLLNLDVCYWPRVEKTSGCWLWRGAKDGAGYGYVAHLSLPLNVHRIAYRLAHGEIQNGLEICHRCDVPLCVNPDHLFAGTHQENMRDMLAKGRWNGFPNNRKSS